MERNDPTIERDLEDALRRLNAAAVVPPVDEAREAALMAAFDAASRSPRAQSGPRRDHWYLAAFAAAAVVVIAVGIAPAPPGRHGNPSGGPAAPHTPPSARDVRLEPPSEFVIVPGALGLPRMESGTLVRIDVPVALLPSLGVTPPPVAGSASTVRADVIVAQDGLPRAVRLVAQ
jgi:hypothetical protein